MLCVKLGDLSFRQLGLSEVYTVGGRIQLPATKDGTAQVIDGVGVIRLGDDVEDATTRLAPLAEVCCAAVACVDCTLLIRSWLRLLAATSAHKACVAAWTLRRRSELHGGCSASVVSGVVCEIILTMWA